MAKVTFDQNGNMHNAENGKKMSRDDILALDGLSSADAIPVTLDETGVKMPPPVVPPEILKIKEERERARQKRLEEQERQKDDFEESNNEKEKTVAQSDNSSFKTPNIPKGPTSFNLKKTKYEITPESYFLVKFGLVQKDDGRFVPIKESAVEEIPDAEMHWVKFRMWTYTEELSWKEKCTEYDSKSKMQVISNTKLNEMKIKNLMLDWSFGEYESALKLLHCDGKLSDESYNMFKGMYPSIANTIVDLMNLVLESNQ